MKTKQMPKRIGVLTSGSDCPGLNAAIRAIGKSANGQGIEIIGFLDGFTGLVNDQTAIPPLSGILTMGGTTLGTSRDAVVESSEMGEVNHLEAAINTYQRHQLDALVCIGGLRTLESAQALIQRGLNIVALPAGVDHPVSGTDTAIGFDTAMATATEAIDRLHATAHSHHRIMLVEVMGRRCGWLTLGSGIAGGADVIILPEIPYTLNSISNAIKDRNQRGRRFSIVAVAEGGVSKETVDFFERSKTMNRRLRSGEDAAQVDQRLESIAGQLSGNTLFLANRLEQLTGLETRITILGHLLRGGTPSATDRVLAIQLGTAAVDCIVAQKFNVMMAMRNSSVHAIPIAEANHVNTVPLDHAWIKSARSVGTNLGD